MTKPTRLKLALGLASSALAAGCVGVPESGKQLEAGVRGVVDAVPSNAQIRERNRQRAERQAEWERKSEEAKVQRTLSEARRRQTQASQEFIRAGGEGGGGGGGDGGH